MTHDPRACRICLEGEEGEMIAPCACSGSIKWVHRACLDKWRCKSEEAFTKCPNCKSVYQLEHVREASEKEPWRLFILLACDLLVGAGLFFIFTTGAGFLIVKNCDPQTVLDACQSDHVLVWTLVGSVVAFAIIGLLVLIAMTCWGGGGAPMPPQIDACGLVLVTLMGFMMTLYITYDAVRARWEIHIGGRRRQIRVLEFVVRDLSSPEVV